MNRETGLIDADTCTGEQTKRQLGVMHAACASASARARTFMHFACVLLMSTCRKVKCTHNMRNRSIGNAHFSYMCSIHTCTMCHASWLLRMQRMYLKGIAFGCRCRHIYIYVFFLFVSLLCFLLLIFDFGFDSFCSPKI